MYLGLDIGLSRLTAHLLDAEYAPRLQIDAPLTVSRPLPGAAEQRPTDWLLAAEIALSGLSAQSDLSRLRAIGLSGPMGTPVLLDDADRVLADCLLPQDIRLTPGGDALRFVRETVPAIWAACATVCAPKDYLRLWLTGERATDLSDADALGRDSDLPLPPVLAGDQVSGGLRDVLADRFGLPAGLPVVAGAGNRAALLLALGARAPGDICLAPDMPEEALTLCPVGTPGAKAHCLPDQAYLVQPLSDAARSAQRIRALQTGSERIADLATAWQTGIELVESPWGHPARGAALLAAAGLAGPGWEWPDPPARHIAPAAPTAATRSRI